jgi:hypothetical protein
MGDVFDLGPSFKDKHARRIEKPGYYDLVVAGSRNADFSDVLYG